MAPAAGSASTSTRWTRIPSSYIWALRSPRGLPGLVEASRRGAHLWLLFDLAISALAARRVLLAPLEELCASGLSVPARELYPEITPTGALGHAVRLPRAEALTPRRT